MIKLGRPGLNNGFSTVVWLIGEKIYGLSQGVKVREVVDQPLFFLALVALVIGAQLFLTGFIAELMTSNKAKEPEYKIDEEINLNF